MADLSLTERDRQVLSLALWLLIQDAHHHAAVAAQDHLGVLYSLGDCERFLKDAEDAEKLRAVLAALHPQPKGEP